MYPLTYCSTSALICYLFQDINERRTTQYRQWFRSFFASSDYLAEKRDIACHRIDFMGQPLLLKKVFSNLLGQKFKFRYHDSIING
ncbi:hypothetical protein PAECIP111890_00732 [Paenibacillus sp. JJ-223]|nr:hypothetical protein PAECIP111890_00732 [Paenibacillus sp. JJ-223]